MVQPLPFCEKCPGCQTELFAASAFNGDNSQAIDARAKAVCATCGAILRVTDDMKVVEFTREELRALPRCTRVQLQEAQRWVREQAVPSVQPLSTRCAACNGQFWSMSGNAKAGDVCMCDECGTALMLTEDLGTRLIPPKEYARLSTETRESFEAAKRWLAEQKSLLKRQTN